LTNAWWSEFSAGNDSGDQGMTGRSPLLVTEDRPAALLALSCSRDRGEADRARAVVLTLAGWTSARIAEAFGLREDMVRLWRSDFIRAGIDLLRASVTPGPKPVKSEAALRAAMPLLEQPVADGHNRTLPRLRAKIEARGRAHQPLATLQGTA